MLPPFAQAGSGLDLEPELPLPVWPGQVLQPVRVFRCGPQPKAIAITPDGLQAWVTYLDGPPSVGVYALPSGRRLGEIWLGNNGAVEVVCRIDGRTVYVSQMETHRVFEIDRASRVVRRVFDTEGQWSKVVTPSPCGRWLYVSNWNTHDISVIDLGTGRCVRRLPTVNTPRGIVATVDGLALFVAGFGDGALERMTLETGARKLLFQGVALRHIVADAAQANLYLTDMGGACVWKHTVVDGRTTRLAGTDSNPNTAALSPDDVLFVSNRGPNGADGYLADGPAYGSVLAIDAADGSILDSIVGGNQCTALALSPDGRMLLFSDFRDNTIRVYSVPSVGTLRAASWPRRDLHTADLRKQRRG